MEEFILSQVAEQEDGMAKAERTVDELVAMIENHDLELPEMQREYVWRSTRVRDLLDSLYCGYPSGVILVWQTSSEVARNDFAVDTLGERIGKSMLLLDGQQRLTSLLAVLRGEHVTVRGRKKPIDILFNLDHPEEVGFVTEVFENGNDEDDDVDDGNEIEDGDTEETDLQKRMRLRTFVVSSKQLASLRNWVSVTAVMKSTSDAPFLQAAGVTGFDHPDFDKYTSRLKKLRDIKRYGYRMDILEDTLSYAEVTEIFVRVNSLGAKLRSSDLALAQITARWPGSLKQFREFRDQCGKEGFSLELGAHLRMMIALLTHQSRFDTVGSLTRTQLEDGWNRAQKAMRHAINFARANAGIESPALLSSPFIIIAIGYWADKRNFRPTTEDSVRMRQWLLTANAKGRYSRGSSESILDQDLANLRDGGAASQLMDRLLQQVGRLDVVPEDLEGRTARSALFKAMYLAFAKDHAKDWDTNLAISVGHAGVADRLQFHHIFPKAFLKQHAGDLKQPQVDDIANLAFIGGSTNQGISAKPPAQYLARLAEINAHRLSAQQVPTDTSLFTAERYLEFLAARRVLIASRLMNRAGKVGEYGLTRHDSVTLLSCRRQDDPEIRCGGCRFFAFSSTSCFCSRYRFT
jgi:hypothetical protein